MKVEIERRLHRRLIPSPVFICKEKKDLRLFSSSSLRSLSTPSHTPTGELITNQCAIYYYKCIFDMLLPFLVLLVIFLLSAPAWRLHLESHFGEKPSFLTQYFQLSSGLHFSTFQLFMIQITVLKMTDPL